MFLKQFSTTWGLLLVCLFIVYIYIIYFPCSSKNSECSFDEENKLKTSFPSYLKANEAIRLRFIEKRNRDILSDRKMDEIGLWEKIGGSWNWVWNSFPPVFTCPHFIERIGTAADGGKWICGLELFERGL
jgi:hypothetical protein